MAPEGWEPIAAKKAWDNRKNILGIWKKLERLLLGKKSTIAFTGYSGAGKSVLADYLTGVGFQPEYKPPLKSESEEKSKIKKDKKRMGFVVVPGQASTTRSESLDKLFDGKQTVDGVVHVVSYGYVHIRREEARQIFRGSSKVKTLQDYCEFHRKKELEDFIEVAQQIRRGQRKNRKPVWMLLAATKYDLFLSEWTEAESYYLRDAESPFREAVDQLQNQVGSDNFRWSVEPICTWLEDFEYNKEVAPTSITAKKRDQYVARFLERMVNYCER